MRRAILILFLMAGCDASETMGDAQDKESSHIGDTGSDSDNGFAGTDTANQGADGGATDGEETSRCSDYYDAGLGALELSADEQALPLLCPTCSPIPYEERDVLFLGNLPPLCEATRSPIEPEEAEELGLPVAAYTSAITAEITVPIRWSNSEREVILTATVEPTGRYMLVDMAEDDEDNAGCNDYLEVWLRIHIRTSDNSLVGVILGYSELMLDEAIGDFVRVWGGVKEATLCGNLVLSYPEKVPELVPQSLYPSLDMVYYPGGQHPTNLTLIIYAFYGTSLYRISEGVGVSVARARSTAECEVPDGIICQ